MTEVIMALLLSFSFAVFVVLVIWLALGRLP
jgi:hypothetical protein